MPRSFSMSNPSWWSVATHTGTERSFVYVSASGESRRIQLVCEDVGTASRSGPSSRSNHVARNRSNAAVVCTRAVSSASRSCRSEMPFSSSWRRTGSGCPERRGVQLLVRGEQVAALVVEARGDRELALAEDVAIGVSRRRREQRLRRPQRHLLAVPLDARREQGVLERVVPLRELRRHDPALAGLAQPVQPLAGVSLGPLLGGSERLELRRA